MDDLTVISVVECDHGTLDLMIRSVLRFTSPAPKFVICCNNLKESTNISHIYRGANVKVISNQPKLKGGSNRHGSGLCAAFAQVDTKYTAIIESDCVVLSDKWCDLGEKDFRAAIKGPGLYHVCFLVFRTEALRGIDFRPGTSKNRDNRAYKPEEDVGWQLGKYIKGDVDLIEFVDCKMDRAKEFGRLQSDEFHKDGKLIAGHFGRGSNLAGKKATKFGIHEEQLKRWKEIANRLIKEEEK